MATTEKVGQDSVDIETAGSPNPPAQIGKVELDLDDAPFLRAEEEATPAPVEEAINAAPDADAAEKARRKKKRLLILAGAALGLIILLAVAAWWFFFRTPPPPPPEAPKPDVIVVPSTPADASQPDIAAGFEPFIVPVTGADGKTNFLVCQFTAISKDQTIARELGQKIIPLRDAIYFYLRGKDANFLLDARNGAGIKSELLSVFNDYLTQGKLEDIVFESYLSK